MNTLSFGAIFPASSIHGSSTPAGASVPADAGGRTIDTAALLSMEGLLTRAPDRI